MLHLQLDKARISYETQKHENTFVKPLHFIHLTTVVTIQYLIPLLVVLDVGEDVHGASHHTNSDNASMDTLLREGDAGTWRT